MKGDFSRQTFDPAKHYSTVRMQQGRVQLDADWNEQADLALYREEAAAASLVGGCGGPLGGAAFKPILSAAELSKEELAWLEEHEPKFTFDKGDFLLSPGRYFADGALCECEHPVPYAKQADLPGLEAIKVAEKGSTIVYLDVWQRHVTWLDDPLLRETALGGADTATRTKTVWQVRTIFVKDKKITCAEDSGDYRDATAPSTGTLKARARREAADPDPCSVPESAGYRGLENQLYRVEIHAGGKALDLAAAGTETAVKRVAPDQVVYAEGKWQIGQDVEVFRSAVDSDPMEGWLATVVGHDAKTKTLTLSATLPDLIAADAPRLRLAGATYKWSHDNGSIVTLATAKGRDVKVESLGPDETHRFQRDDWVELIDEVTELKGLPGFLTQVAAVDTPAKTVILRGEPLTKFTGKLLKLRRWDGAGAAKRNPKPTATATPFAELEEGVQVAFSEGTYKNGDHWLIPARTATTEERFGTIEWPLDETKDKKDKEPQPLALRPLGIRHRYCKLAILESDGKKLTLAEDCRSLFPPLTRFDSLAYVGGDGQEGLPGKPLAQPLEAGVFRGPLAVKGAKVRFTAKDGGTLVDPAAPGGGAKASLDLISGDNGLVACTWLPAADSKRPSQRVEARLLDADGKKELPPRLDYNTQLSIASQVAYEPGACAGLAQAKTVQEALDELCRRPVGEGGCCRQVKPGESLDEILTKFVKEKERSICLCLGPGDYTLGIPLVRPELSAPVTIVGSGPATKLRVKGVVFEGVPAIRLADLSVTLTGKDPLAFVRCGSVVLERCAISGPDQPKGLACAIVSGRALISGCVLAGGDKLLMVPALALESGAEVAIDNTEIRGPLVVYGRTPYTVFNRKVRARMVEIGLGMEAAHAAFVEANAKRAAVAQLAAGSLHIRDSMLTLITIDQLSLAKLEEGRVLRSFHMTDTLVKSQPSMVFALHAVLSAVEFEADEKPYGVFGVSSTSAIITSTVGSPRAILYHVARRIAAAANLIKLETTE